MRKNITNIKTHTNLINKVKLAANNNNMAQHSPIGTNGFSLVFRMNLSLKLSSLGRGRGEKPWITGGSEKLKAPATGGAVLAAEASCCTGEDAAAMMEPLTQDDAPNLAACIAHAWKCRACAVGINLVS